MKHIKFMMVTASALIAVACGETEDVSDLEATWANVNDKVIKESCLDSTCHNSSDKRGGLDLESSGLPGRLIDAEVTNATAKAQGLKLVVASDSDKSLLYRFMAATAKKDFGLQMPLTGELSSDRVDLVKRWIDAGAK